MTDAYISISCPNCESQYSIEFIEEKVDGSPEYCPFCGDGIPEETPEELEEEDEDDNWD